MSQTQELVFGRTELVEHVEAKLIREHVPVTVVLSVGGCRNIDFVSEFTIIGDDVTVMYKGEALPLYSPSYNNYTLAIFVGFCYQRPA